MVTDQQVALLRQRQMEGKKQQTAAAMAGMSERSARKWQCGPLPSETKTERRWRTRPDPFDGVWEEEILPLLQGEAAGRLRATTIIEWLEEKSPGRFSASQLRTLQRRLQDWRALNGPDQEVYFPQEHPPQSPALTASGRKKSCPCSKARPPAGSGQRQLSSGWRRNPPAGSAPPSSAPCNADYRTGGHSTVRIRRSTSPKSIHLAGRRSSTSPTATPWE